MVFAVDNDKSKMMTVIARFHLWKILKENIGKSSVFPA